MTAVSLLVVNFRSAALTANAIATARRSATGPLQVVVIDNSCDPAERAALETLRPDELIVAEANLGYAKAINRAAERCAGDSVVISNPDVEFRGDAIDRLVGALGDDVGVSGPRFVWDSAGEWLLPPADVPSAREKTLDVLAERLTQVRRRRSQALLRRRIAFWSLTAGATFPSLSGAVMAVRRDVLARFRFDERFQLYFEEADFMRRLRESGLSIVYEPGAECRHLFAQSSSGIESSDALYAESERLFFAKWGGTRLIRIASTLSLRPPADESFQQLTEPVIALTEPHTSILVEASPLPDFRSAAGHFPRSPEVRIPQEILSTYRYPHLFLREVELDNGRIGRRWVFSKYV